MLGMKADYRLWENIQIHVCLVVSFHLPCSTHSHSYSGSEVQNVLYIQKELLLFKNIPAVALLGHPNSNSIAFLFFPKCA